MTQPLVTTNQIVQSLAPRFQGEADEGLISAIVSEFLRKTTTALADGNRVSLDDLGILRTKIDPARERRNPQNPDSPVQVPDTARVRFKAGAKLHRAVQRQVGKGVAA